MLVLLVGGTTAFVQLTTWKVGTDFSVKFSGKGVNGIFKNFEANILFDEANPAASKFTITIDVASLNTGNAMQNRHATGSEWFDAATYPKIKFTSTAVEKSGSGYVAKGKMEVKGKVRDIAIPFSFSKSGTGGEFSATFPIKRVDYGVGNAGGDVAEEIKVEVKVPVTSS